MPFILLGLIVLLIIVTIFKKSKSQQAQHKGKRGESIVSSRLGESEPQKKYVINNYMIDLGEGKSSQIDHIYIDHHGVWVIETKTYSGKIFGTEEQQEWTQVLAYGHEKHKFYNPVKQNATHIYHLRKIIGYDVPIHSLVVFVTGDISAVRASNVCMSRNMMNIILNYQGKQYSGEEIEAWFNVLEGKRATVVVTEEEHVQNVRQQQRNLQAGICPRCQGKLVLRKGKYGQFYGCSNYPKCKFIKK